MALITSAKYFGYFLIYLKCTQFIHAQCSTVHDIPQCKCSNNKRFACNRLHSFSQLFLIASKLYGRELFELVIRSSKLRFWPSSIFSNIKIDKIYLDKCEILTFEKEDYSQGSEGSFKELVATKTNLIENGEWKLNIRLLKTLTNLSIQNIDVPKLTQSLSYGLPEGLKELSFIDCEIRELEGIFFSPLRNIERLNLVRNRITNLRQEINTLPQLTILNLGENEILQLPGNVMQIFPKLNSLILQNNEMEHLPENVWKNIFEKVATVNLEDNPLKCDADMKWIVQIKDKWKLTGMQCDEPERLRREYIKYLRSVDFEQ